MYLFLIVCLLVCVLVYQTKFCNRRFYNEVVQLYPACFRELPVVGPFYKFVGNTEELMTTLVKVANTTVELGGISRLCGLNYCVLVLTNAQDAAEVLKCYLNKDYLYSFLYPVNGKASVFNTEYTDSKVRRQCLLPSLRPQHMSSYIDPMWRQCVRLTEALAPHAGQGPFRIGSYLGGFCYDNVIGAADVEEIKEELNSERASENYKRCFQLVVQRWISLWMQADVLYKLSSNHRELERRVAALYTYTYRAQDIRSNKLARLNLQKSTDYGTGEKEDGIMKHGLIDSLIDSKLTRREVCEEMLVILGACDEAGLNINFTLKLLGQYPSVQDKAYEELKDVFGDSDRPFVKEDLTKTRYLDMLIHESLRLYPPVPFILRKAHKETKLSSGNIIPAGAGLAVAIYSLHRDPRCWGPDAEHFDPERFLPERLAAVPDNAYMPFSYGPRSCPGSKFAFFVMKLGLCAILRKYKVVGAPAAGPVPDIPVKYQIAMRPVDDHIELVNRN